MKTITDHDLGGSSTRKVKEVVAIIGHGYVGKAVEELFLHRRDLYDIVLYDPAQGYTDQAAVNEADLAIVCVPTPEAADGSCDLTAIKETFSWLRAKLVLLKSTVPPGTTKLENNLPDQEIVFSPEFIGEGKYHVDAERYPHPTEMILHKFQIFGGNKAACGRVINFFMPIMGPSVKYRITDSTTAELVKYTINNWAANKVTFANQIYDIAKASGVEYEELRQLILEDGRIEAMHTAVFPDKRGFDGKCLPKDNRALIKYANSLGLPVTLLEAVNTTNLHYLELNK